MYSPEESNSRKNHPAMKDMGKLTPENHEKITPYDHQLDLDKNMSWKLWQNEINEYFGNSGWNR